MSHYEPISPVSVEGLSLSLTRGPVAIAVEV